MMLIMRYDAVNSQQDRINGLGPNGGLAFDPDTLEASLTTPFFAPVRATRSRITPGVQFLIHANIKTSFEYQIRPRQQITPSAGLVNPVDLTSPIVLNPFRVNTAVVGLEFVY
jgi:hypothetical protein